MNKIEILCATMNQSDFSKIEEMNIKSDVVFANQADRYDYSEKKFDGGTAKMITTAERGVGKNRNTALLYASGSICLIADDDIRYSDDYVRTVTQAFEELPDADIILFNFTTTNEERRQAPITKLTRFRRWSRSGFAAFNIAFRLDAVQKANIWFSVLYGGGAKYSSGEDSLWINDALKAGLKIYRHPAVIGEVNFDVSSWFNGYTEKFFVDKGVIYANMHPTICGLRSLVFLATHTRLYKGTYTFSQAYKLMKRGIKEFKTHN
ncbi:MAG: glycosyltransferase family 2 protein [Firmicutes bacterium]|nr:glycosyltransferase family 2 protein [Bacillota bacterium]